MVFELGRAILLVHLLNVDRVLERAAVIPLLGVRIFAVRVVLRVRRSVLAGVGILRLDAALVVVHLEGAVRGLLPDVGRLFGTGVVCGDRRAGHAALLVIQRLGPRAVGGDVHLPGDMAVLRVVRLLAGVVRIEDHHAARVIRIREVLDLLRAEQVATRVQNVPFGHAAVLVLGDDVELAARDAVRVLLLGMVKHAVREVLGVHRTVLADVDGLRLCAALVEGLPVEGAVQVVDLDVRGDIRIRMVRQGRLAQQRALAVVDLLSQRVARLVHGQIDVLFGHTAVGIAVLDGTAHAVFVDLSGIRVIRKRPDDLGEHAVGVILRARRAVGLRIHHLNELSVLVEALRGAAVRAGAQRLRQRAVVRKVLLITGAALPDARNAGDGVRIPVVRIGGRTQQVVPAVVDLLDRHAVQLVKRPADMALDQVVVRVVVQRILAPAVHIMVLPAAAVVLPVRIDCGHAALVEVLIPADAVLDGDDVRLLPAVAVELRDAFKNHAAVRIVPELPRLAVHFIILVGVVPALHAVRLNAQLFDHVPPHVIAPGCDRITHILTDRLLQAIGVVVVGVGRRARQRVAVVIVAPLHLQAGRIVFGCAAGHQLTVRIIAGGFGLVAVLVIALLRPVSVRTGHRPVRQRVRIAVIGGHHAGGLLVLAFIVDRQRPAVQHVIFKARGIFRDALAVLVDSAEQVAVHTIGVDVAEVCALIDLLRDLVRALEVGADAVPVLHAVGLPPVGLDVVAALVIVELPHIAFSVDGALIAALPGIAMILHGGRPGHQAVPVGLRGGGTAAQSVIESLPRRAVRIHIPRRREVPRIAVVAAGRGGDQRSILAVAGGLHGAALLIAHKDVAADEIALRVVIDRLDLVAVLIEAVIMRAGHRVPLHRARGLPAAALILVGHGAGQVALSVEARAADHAALPVVRKNLPAEQPAVRVVAGGLLGVALAVQHLALPGAVRPLHDER